MANDFGMKLLYGLVVLFVLGIIELLMIPILESKLVPYLISSTNTTLNPADVVSFTAQTTTVIRFIDVTMYVLMFVTVIFLIVSIFKKEETVSYQ